MNFAAAKVVIDSCAASCCGTPSAATPGSAFSAASISTRRSSCDLLPHEFLKTRLIGIPATGTIGILKALCVDRTLSAEEADAVLGRMVAIVFYSPIRRISDLL